MRHSRLVLTTLTAGAVLLTGCASEPQGPRFHSGSAAVQRGDHFVERVGACDFSGDDRLDFVVSGPTPAGQQRTTVLATGGGRFTTDLQLERGFGALATGDFDGDNHCDFAGLTGGQGGGSRSDFRLFYSAGEGRFPATVSRSARAAYPRALAAGELDGDGLADLAVFYKTFRDKTDTVVFPGSADRDRPRQPRTHRIGTTAAAALATDIDGDGDTDLATLGRDRRIHLLVNRPGTFDRESSRAYDQAAGPGLAASLIHGDFDGDGDADLAVADAGVDRVFLFTGDERPAMAATYRFPSHAGPRDLAAADLDGDGDDDLVVLRQGPDGPVITALQVVADGSGLTFRNTGDRRVADITEAARLHLADLDEAGGPDAVVWGRADEAPWVATIRDLRIVTGSP